jgi:class 3 adenylate cyclase
VLQGLSGRTGSGAWARVAAWTFHIALPALLLWLLIARPQLDLRWENHAAHFGLVLGTALLNVVLGVLMAGAAGRRSDPRLLLVAWAFLVAAGFLGLHALATPEVLVDQPSAGFVLATPVGLCVGGLLALASGADWSPAAAARLIRLRWALTAALLAAMAAWAVVSVAGWPPLDEPLPPEEARGPLVALAFGGTALYGAAAYRYLGVHRRRPAVVLLSLVTAFALLALAMFAIAYGRNWQASWWEWHILMGAAFGFVAYSAYVQFQREGSARGLFDSITLEQTVDSIRRDHRAALEELVAAMEAEQADGTSADLGRAGALLADRFDLTEQQVAVLERAAEALGAEREQARRLGGLVAVGREASVIQSEGALVARALAVGRAAFRGQDLALGLLRGGTLTLVDGQGTSNEGQWGAAMASLAPVASQDGRVLVLPLQVKGRAAGLLEVRNRHDVAFGDADTALLESFASQLSIALENTRLYRQMEGLFRSYMSPSVATALIADPDQAGLGGTIAEVSVLMADLRGFTPFSERAQPAEVVAMLNAYYGAVVPVILDRGGTVTQFVGDAVMAIFNAPVRQADHARRAGAAALRLHRAIDEVRAGRAGWPRFRAGINTGPALIGNVGSAEMRSFTAVGDTTNVAARLESLAEPGQVVIGALTRTQIGDAATITALGAVAVKGREQPVEAFVLHDLR